MNSIQTDHGNNPTTVHCLCLIHPIDPRGRKVGGIETHVRLLLRFAPMNWRVLLVGVDGHGDCEVGKLTSIIVDGRAIDFLPVIHFPEDNIHEAATSLTRSLTARFWFGLLRHLLPIRRALGNGPATIELQRYEFSVTALLLRRPAIQLIHGEGSKRDRMDSLIKKYWLVHRTMEEIAIRAAHAIVCVNPSIEARIKRKLPARLGSIEFMPVPVDTTVFTEAAFDHRDGVFRVVFSGRLDEFKDPPTMFRTFEAVHERLGGRFEFHYIGTSDPRRYAEFAAIEPYTVRHGHCTASEVAAISARCHAGILTSFFEGMPCYLLELLAIGRPVVAIRLPQYDLVLEEGVSGAYVERQTDEAATVSELADRLVEIWASIERDALNPLQIRAKAERFSTGSLLARHFERHRQVWNASRSRRAAGLASTGAIS